jgi:MFS transporter, ACS family, glucarate transporter
MGRNDQLEQPTRVRFLVLAVACTLAVLTYMQRQGFVAGTPRLQEDLHLDDEQLGYLLAGWLLAYGAFQVPGGLLGDWLGARHLLTILVLGWSLMLGAVALIALLPVGTWLPFALLLLLRCLFGMCQGGGFPGLARVVADWIPTPQRGFAQGLIWTFSRFGGFVAPLLVLQFFKLFGDWPVPFLILGSLGVVWCACFWPWFRNRPGQMPQVNDAERVLIEAGRPVAISLVEPTPWARLLASRSAWALCLMYGFLGFSGNFFTNWLPSYLKNHRHLSEDTALWLSSQPLAFGIISCVLGGVASDWLIHRTGSRNWGRRLVGGTSMALAAVTMLLSIWIEQVWLLGMAFNMTFFFNDATMGPAWASCADVGERHAGTLSGAMNMTGQLLAAIAMFGAGWFFKRHLDAVVFVAFACSYGLAALCWLAVDVTKPITSTQ